MPPLPRRPLALLTLLVLLVAGCTTPPVDGPGTAPGNPGPGTGGGAGDGTGDGGGQGTGDDAGDGDGSGQGGLGGSDPGTGPGSPTNTTDPPEGLEDGFTWHLLRTLRDAAPGTNLFTSPVSIAAALCLALEGAQGTTREAIALTLGLGDEPGEDCRDLVGSLARERNASGAEVGVANSVWVRDDFAPAVKPAYLAALRDDFHAEGFVRPFDTTTKDELNAWVANQTRDMVPTLLDELPEDLVVLLVNAIHFQGWWEKPFDKNRTEEADFHLADGSTVQVPMMRNESARMVRMTGGDGFRAAYIPYADGEHAMVVVLPDHGAALDEVASNLTDEAWDALLGRMVPEMTVDLALPRFELTWGAELNDALRAMGMGVAFDPAAANFTGIADIAPQRLFLSLVVHKATLEVDEEGTRAAAATVVGTMPTSLPPPPPVFHVDRPFLVAIVDTEVAMPLFVGVVEDPRGA